MPWLIIAGVVLIIYLLCQMVEFILGVFNRTYPIVSLLCFFPVLALIIFLGTVLSSEIDVTLEDTIQFGLAIALELILIVAALSLLYCYKNSKERSITLKMRFSISYSPFTKKIMSNETAIVFKEEYSGEIQEKLLAPLEYDESSEEQYGKQYFVEHDFIFRKVSHGTRFSFSLIDHKDRKYELLWNGECSSPRNTKVPFVDTRMDVDISLAMVRFEMFMLANERLENKTLEPKVKLNNYPLNINTEYRVPKGTYEIDFSVPDELLGSWCLEIDGRTVYEKSNVLSFKVEKDTHIPISLKEISPARIFIELENANGAEQNYTLLMAKKIVLQNVKTKKEYSITEDGDRLFFEVPGGVYVAEVNSLVFGKYYIRGEFGDSGLEKTEIEIGYGQESEVVLKAFGYPLKQVIFSLTDVKSINLISNVTVENTEGVLYSGKTSKNTVQFSLPEGSYKAQFSLKEVDKTYVEVLVNNKPGKTHRFEVKRTDLLIPIEVRKTEWPKLQLNISNPSNAAVSVLVDELTVENHAIQVKKGVHKIKLSIPQDNELFSYESFINGTEGKSYSLKIEDSTSVLIEIKKTQKLESTNHKLDLLDLASVDYYSLLGVDETATAQEIKRAYALALRRSSTNDDCSSIRKAYEILSSESLKSKYDSYRKYGRSIRSMMNEAEECFSRDEDNKALAITEEILNIDPDLVEARRLRSMCLTKVDRIMDSVKEMEKVILLDPLNPEHWLYCGMGYRRLFGDTEKAKYFDQAKSKTLVAVDLQPYNAEPYIALAELFIDNSDFDEALEYCDRAINADGKIDIHDFEAMFLKAKIHILASDPERTRDVADEILEAIPDDQEIREYVAAKFLEYSRLFYKNKNLELAILFIENAMKFDKSKELRGFRDHLKIANDAVGEIKTYESDSTIIRPIKALAGILIQKNYLTVDDEEEKELDDLFDKWLKSLNDIRVSTIRDSINLTRKNYPKIYIACKKFFIALEEAIS
ncbi:J domain-containing protein [Mesotoga prima]|uniref:J domain-containing protein n=1 Tax=Mesotoga prima TaxID=1184387 RepID=UPI001BD65E5B|nr:DnaJ domain-containing protein [Mesotoga prima]HQC14975.1 hypothetical protein [Mesotoga prima]